MTCRAVPKACRPGARAHARPTLGGIPRPLRDFVPGGYYHVTCRGVDGRAIAHDDEDRERFVVLLRAAGRRAAWGVHAWCLMPNHYHLLLEAGMGDVSGGLRYLNGRYAQSFNLRHERRGHLWGERARAWQVESEEHYEAAVAYVLENPVRAGLVRSWDEWPWLGSRLVEPGASAWATGARGRS